MEPTSCLFQKENQFPDPIIFLESMVDLIKFGFHMRSNQKLRIHLRWAKGGLPIITQAAIGSMYWTFRAKNPPSVWDCRQKGRTVTRMWHWRWWC